MPEHNRKAGALARWVLPLCLLAGAAGAQVQSVTSDLDADGRAERFSLIGMEDHSADLEIDTGRALIVARDVAWVGGIGQQPELALAPGGSVRLISMNEAIGRNRWRLTLTIAYRDGAYRVAGYTYDWYDTLDLRDRGSCDLNLQSGRGFLTLRDEPPRALRTDAAALPVTEWSEETPMPDACRNR